MFTMSWGIKILLYISILILFTKRKSDVEKLKFIALIALIHVILFFPVVPAILIDPLILIALLLFQIPLWISRETAIFILLVIIFLPVQQFFWIFMLTQVIYVIIIGGLIYATLFEKIPKKEESEKPETN